MEQPSPTLEYRKPLRSLSLRSIGVAAGHYVGLVVGMFATILLGDIFFPQRLDPEAHFFFIITCVFLAAIFFVPSFCVWGAMWIWGRLTRRFACGHYWLKAMLISGASSCAGLMGSEIPRIAHFLDRPAGWTYYLAAWLLVPLAFHLVLTRKAIDIDSAATR